MASEEPWIGFGAVVHLNPWDSTEGQSVEDLLKEIEDLAGISRLSTLCCFDLM